MLSTRGSVRRGEINGRRLVKSMKKIILGRRRTGKKGAMEGMMTGGLGRLRGIPPMKTNGNIKKRTRRSRIIL